VKFNIWVLKKLLSCCLCRHQLNNFSIPIPTIPKIPMKKIKNALLLWFWRGSSLWNDIYKSIDICPPYPNNMLCRPPKWIACRVAYSTVQTYGKVYCLHSLPLVCIRFVHSPLLGTNVGEHIQVEKNETKQNDYRIFFVFGSNHAMDFLCYDIIIFVCLRKSLISKPALIWCVLYFLCVFLKWFLTTVNLFSHLLVRNATKSFIHKCKDNYWFQKRLTRSATPPPLLRNSKYVEIINGVIPDAIKTI